MIDPGGLGDSGTNQLVVSVIFAIPWVIVCSLIVFTQSAIGGVTARDMQLAAAMVLALGIASFVLWRRWKAADAARRGGGRERRVLIMRGAMHLWRGIPNSTAEPHSISALDIRSVTAHRHVPLLGDPNAPVLARISLDTPLSNWARTPPSTRWYSHWLGLVSRERDDAMGVMWAPLPDGLSADAYAQQLELALHGGQVEDVALVRANQSSRWKVPATQEASTPALPLMCPCCSSPLPEGSATTEPWWEPLPGPVRCAKCGLEAPAGSIVIMGSRSAGYTVDDPESTKVCMALLLLLVVFLGLGLLLDSHVIGDGALRSWGKVLKFAAAVPFLCFWGYAVVLYRRPVARPRARFQRGTLAWIVEPGALRLLRRGRLGRERRIPAKGISSIALCTPYLGRGQIDFARTEQLFASGTAPELGLIGEVWIGIAVPSELSRGLLEERVLTVLRQE